MPLQVDHRVEEDMPVEARVSQAKTALDAYERAHDRGEDTETVISDLLADLMHFCDQAKTFAWQTVLDRAEHHHHVEREIGR